MKLDNIDIEATLTTARKLLKEEEGLSPAFHATMEMLLMLVALLLNRVTLNSKNSSKPPSSDPNRVKSRRKPSGKPSGGQPGHVGATLKKIDDPDEIRVLKVDRRHLPRGHRYTEVGFESRQVFDIDIRRVVTEYQAQVLEDEQGRRFVAPFPDGVDHAVQYGNRVKAHAVYLSQYQLLPYKRIQEYFADQLQMPLSEGSLFNFNRQAFEQLAEFEQITRQHLEQADVCHADETGINIDSQRHWLHCASNASWTLYQAHRKRGTEAMDAMGVLPRYQGILCHDHWKPYYTYTDCTHALCNAHHLRELTRAWEQDGQQWAKDMEDLLLKINEAVDEQGGALPGKQAKKYRQTYRSLLKRAEDVCPAPIRPPGSRKRGRLKRSKARNLLERLIDYEDDVLRFMEHPQVPFTNNLAERDVRMTKVQQKISGCFRSMDGALMFCRIRGYLSTCRKQGLSASDALALGFAGKLPDFAQMG